MSSSDHGAPFGGEGGEPIAVEKNGPIVWITLGRPNKANALNVDMILALSEALHAAEECSEARAVIIRGAGANFCGGADLSELLAGGSGGVRAMMDPLRNLLCRIEQSHLAVIAAVHGAARAGGLELALSCDAVVASEGATFGDAHLANSLLPAGGATARLPRTIGWQRAKWLILSATSISAATARDWGLVLEVSRDGELWESAERLARLIASADRETFKKAKQLLADTSDRFFSASLESEISTLEIHSQSTAFQEGVGGFLARKRTAAGRKSS